MAGDVEVLQPNFTLKAGVVNHDLVFCTQTLGDAQPVANDFIGELVNYVILMDVAKNITTGEDAKFGL